VSKPSLAQSSHLVFPEQGFALRVKSINKQANHKSRQAEQAKQASKQPSKQGKQAMKQNKQASKPLFSSIDIEKQAPSIDESHWRVLLVLYIHVFHCQSILSCVLLTCLKP